MSELISVIVPCYNQAQYLDECLQSVLDQTYQNWECIIVNDGSPDDTEQISKKWTEKDVRFKYFKKNNGGLSSARNFGIEHSQGEFILPLDSDDCISDNYLEDCIHEITQYNDIKVIYGKGQFFGEKNGEWILPKYSFDELKRINIIFCSAVFRKSDWLLNKGYDEKMKYGLEDWEFWLNLMKRGGEARQIHSCTFFYRIKGGSMLRSLNDTQIHYLYKHVFCKHKELYDFNPIYEHYLRKDIQNNPENHISIQRIFKILIKKLIRR